MAKPIKMLVLDDEKDICKFSKEIFERRGFLVSTALSGAAAMKILKKQSPEIAVLDIYLKGKINGMDILAFIKNTLPDCYCIMVTKEGDLGIKKKAKKLGAYSYLTKPLTLTDLDKTVKKIVLKLEKEGR